MNSYENQTTFDFIATPSLPLSIKRKGNWREDEFSNPLKRPPPFSLFSFSLPC